MTTTILKERTNGLWTKEESKVIEIMKHLIENVKHSYIKPDSYSSSSDNIERGTRMTNDKVDFIFYKNDTEFVTRVNDDDYTLVELFVRQYLNNREDGFGLLNVEECFDYIMDNIDFIIEQEMISEEGYNNSGHKLWSNYRPEHPMVIKY